MLADLTRQAALVERLGSGGGRLRAPGDLVARMKPHFPQAGITRVAQITGLDNVGLPVWAAVRPNAPTLSVCQGKGLTDDDAQASAIMEAVEMGAAERCGPQRIASAAVLESEGERYDLLPSLVRRGHEIAQRHERIGWVEGYDLLAKDPVWLPVGAVRIDATDPHRSYWQSSDGLGSGSLMIEAVLHGLYERIERDAGEIWHLRSDEDVRRSCIDISSLDSPQVSGLDSAVRSAGLHLRLFDITSDVKIPTFYATVSPPPDGREVGWLHFDLTSGMGSDADPARAAAAAIAEALQSRLTTISGARDDYQPGIYAMPIEADILVYPRAEPIRRASLDGQPSRDRLDFILGRLRSAGLDSAIVVPLQDNEDFAVAKVIVPGLELPPGARAVPYGERLCRLMGA